MPTSKHLCCPPLSLQIMLCPFSEVTGITGVGNVVRTSGFSLLLLPFLPVVLLWCRSSTGCSPFREYLLQCGFSTGYSSFRKYVLWCELIHALVSSGVYLLQRGPSAGCSPFVARGCGVACSATLPLPMTLVFPLLFLTLFVPSSSLCPLFSALS